MSQAKDYAEILPNLFMGGQAILPIAPDDFDLVISCREVPDLHVPSLREILTQGGPVLLSVPMMDEAVEVPIVKLQAATSILCDFVSGRALVHCKMGHNRSALVIGAYLIWHYGKTADDAIALIREKRPGALSNETFVKQLRSL